MLRRNQNIKLSQSQIDVMQVLWQNQKLSVSQVHEVMQQSKPLALTTVATVLKRLAEKGIVAFEKVGRQHLYCAQVTEAEVQSSMLGNLLSHLFKGKPEALVHHLVDQADVSAEDIKKIKALLDQEVHND